MTAVKTSLPAPVVELLDAALVAELTVVAPFGPVTYPMIPLSDGTRIWFTSAALFSNTVLAAPTAPKLQPARVNGTQGAGALPPVPPRRL